MITPGKPAWLSENETELTPEKKTACLGGDERRKISNRYKYNRSEADQFLSAHSKNRVDQFYGR
ncbi:MAG: hypothetical protein ACYDG3_01370 [Bacillati bacterium]